MDGPRDVTPRTEVSQRKTDAAWCRLHGESTHAANGLTYKTETDSQPRKRLAAAQGVGRGGRRGRESGTGRRKPSPMGSAACLWRGELYQYPVIRGHHGLNLKKNTRSRVTLLYSSPEHNI